MIKLRVKGMTCNHCVMTVTRALQGVPGVREASVDRERAEAVVDGSAPAAALVAAVREEGYEAEEERG